MRRSGLVVFLVLFSIVISSAGTASAVVLYYSHNDGGPPSTIYSIDTDTMAQAVVVTVAGAWIDGLTTSDLPNVIYAADRSSRNLLEIDVEGGTVSVVGQFLQGVQARLIRGIAYDSESGLLYGRMGNDDLFSIDPQTAQVISNVGNMGVDMLGMTFDPASGILYGYTGLNGVTEELHTINTATAVSTAVNPGQPNVARIDGIFVDPDSGTMYACGRGNSNGLYTLNMMTAALSTSLGTLVGGQARAIAAPTPVIEEIALPVLSLPAVLLLVALLGGCAVFLLRRG